jgi:hypothetical protein
MSANNDESEYEYQEPQPSSRLIVLQKTVDELKNTVNS